MIRAKVYLDEDVDLIVADMLRSQGFSALTAQDAGRKGKIDADQLEFAVQNGMVVLTHNRIDFERLAVEYYELDRDHAGIILAIQRQPKEISTRTLRILNRLSANEIRNQLYYI